MKNFFNKLGRFFKILIVFLLIALCLGLGIGYYLRTRELNSIKSLYTEVQTNLDKSSEESELTKENLETSLQDLNKEVKNLKKENQSLKSRVEELDKTGYAEIQGKIFPFIIADSTFSQYQLVCAENVSNKSLQYCVTVSAVDQNYKLLVPAGTYQVNARVVSTDTSNPITKYKAPYTEYIKCVKDKGIEKCDKTQLSTKIIELEVKAGDEVKDVDPIDWVTQV